MAGLTSICLFFNMVFAQAYLPPQHGQFAGDQPLMPLSAAAPSTLLRGLKNRPAKSFKI